MGVGGQRHDLATLPPGKTRYPLYRRLGRPQGRSGRVWKISPPPGLDPRTVQPLGFLWASHKFPVTKGNVRCLLQMLSVAPVYLHYNSYPTLKCWSCFLFMYIQCIFIVYYLFVPTNAHKHTHTRARVCVCVCVCVCGQN